MGDRPWDVLGSPKAMAWVLLLCAAPACLGVVCIAAGPRLDRPALIEVGPWLFLPLVVLGILAVVVHIALAVARAHDRYRHRAEPEDRRDAA